METKGSKQQLFGRGELPLGDVAEHIVTEVVDMVAEQAKAELRRRVGLPPEEPSPASAALPHTGAWSHMVSEEDLLREGAVPVSHAALTTGQSIQTTHEQRAEPSGSAGVGRGD
jgi:hypothetical protein